MLFSECVFTQAGEQRRHTFETSTTSTGRLNYLLVLPNSYEEKPEKKWPLILFLHGGGQWGENLEDLERVRAPGQLPSVVEQLTDFPFIVVAPQFPRETIWPIDSINALLDEIVPKFTIDTDRIYLTGVSMGGYYTWYFAIDHPERLAAIVPRMEATYQPTIAIVALTLPDSQ